MQRKDSVGEDKMRRKRLLRALKLTPSSGLPQPKRCDESENGSGKKKKSPFVIYAHAGT